MFRPIFVSLCIAGISAMALGAAPDSAGVAFDDPTPAAPATQPVNAPANTPVNPVIVVLPIAPPMNSDNAWVGKAIQQDMVIDLSQMTHGRVIAPPSATPATNEQAALDQARQVNAGFVVYGQAQMSGNQIRVVGQVLDVSTAKPLDSLKATAPADNLFPLEDSLAGQAAHALPYPLGLAGAPQPPAQSEQQGQTPAYASQPPPQNQPYSSAQISSAPQGDPYYSYVDTYPPTYYAYNPYYYTYPYWYSPYGSLWIGFGGGGYWHTPYYWHGGYYGHPYYHGGVFARPGFRGGGGFRGGAIRGGGGRR
jgi:TolB-like protein